jgi:molybdopterin-containing oxidoreductase family molybdopterin binding subunit
MQKWGISPLPEYTEDDTEDKNYPLSLITPNEAGRIHSQFGNLKIISTTVPEPAAGISPSDAKQRRIITGDRIRIHNTAGEVVTIARISNRVPHGIIVLPNGIWLSEGGGGNRLIAGRFTDMGFGAAFHDTRVEVEKAE